MLIAWWGLVGLFAAALVNHAADCWLCPVRLQCGLTRHPARQSAVWVGVPAILALLAWRTSDPDGVGTVCLFAAILILLAVIDLEQRRVPNVVIFPAITLTLIRAGQTGGLTTAAAGAALAFVAFLALFVLGRRLFGPGALGMGDVKLAALIGAIIGLEWMPYALLLAVISVGVAAAVLLLTGRIRRGDSLPFGYFMALAAVIVLIVGFPAG